MIAPAVHNAWQDVCRKCAHRTGCKTPCRPVELHLAEDNLSVFEKSWTNDQGQRCSIIFSRSREYHETALRQADGELPNKIERAFSTENENPFAGFEPSLKQTGVFIDRFFHKWSWKDIAVKHGMSERTAQKTYHNAVKRLGEVLEYMDNPKAVRNLEAWKKRVEERSGSLPKGQRYFLLNKLFDMRPSEIAEMEGMKNSSSVRGLIIRVSDQLSAGEIGLWEVEPKEAEAAKARLDAHRTKRRERHARKKQR